MSKIYKIFAYGSLINQVSLSRTVPRVRNFFPATAFGLTRVFNLASYHRFDTLHQVPVCVLNAEASTPENRLNGACFEMDETSLDNLLEREKEYRFEPIQICHYHDESIRFDAYYFCAKDFQPYRFLASSAEQKHYLQLCLDGSAVFGRCFLEDFKQSTSFWGIDSESDRQAIWDGIY
ncbi:MAG: gamma-glutamylcyclotransferase family protein [Gammaproteobacteria bacterium]